MQPLDTVYLQILKNLCTDSSEPVSYTHLTLPTIA